MGKTFNVFRDVDNLLQVLVLSVAEDRVVDDDSIHVWVGVGFFDCILVDFSQRVAEATSTKPGQPVAVAI